MATFSHPEEELIKKTLAEFFERMTLNVEFTEEIQEDGVNVNISAESPQILIGESGRTLVELQHILRLILLKQLKRPVYLNLDVSDYRKKKEVWLKDLAKSAADEVALTRLEKELPSMPAYERRIVHLVLAERPDIVTESRGEEPNRRIVIKPGNRL